MMDGLHHLTESPEMLPNLLRAWRREWPEMGLLVLVPEAEKALVAAIQAACRETGVPLLGAIFPALVTDAGFSSRGAWLLRFNRMPPAFLAAGLEGDPGVAAGVIADQVSAHLDGGLAPNLFLIFDAMLPNIGSVLTGLFGRLDGRVRYGGVNAGSETFQPVPCLFDGERLVGAGAIGLVLPSTKEVAVSHGYPVTDSLMNATSTAGNRIDHIDGRPAFDVYRDVIRAEFGIELTHANFYDYAAHYPFGLVTTIDVLVRIPVGYTEDGALFCVGEVPPNGKLRLLRAPSLQNSDCVGNLARRLAAGGGVAGRPLLTFYCAGRRMHFGPDSANELALLKAATGAPAIAGALTLGEIDSVEDLDFPRFHNATVVCVA